MKFLRFLFEVLLMPVIGCLEIFLAIMFLCWAFSGFGLIMIAIDYTDHNHHFTWVGYSLIVLDALILLTLICEHIKNAYEKVYKN
jgi:hypothetical protein